MSADRKFNRHSPILFRREIPPLDRGLSGSSSGLGIATTTRFNVRACLVSDEACAAASSRARAGVGARCRQ